MDFYHNYQNTGFLVQGERSLDWTGLSSKNVSIVYMINIESHFKLSKLSVSNWDQLGESCQILVKYFALHMSIIIKEDDISLYHSQAIQAVNWSTIMQILAAKRPAPHPHQNQIDNLAQICK